MRQFLYLSIIHFHSPHITTHIIDKPLWSTVLVVTCLPLRCVMGAPALLLLFAAACAAYKFEIPLDSLPMPKPEERPPYTISVSATPELPAGGVTPPRPADVEFWNPAQVSPVVGVKPSAIQYTVTITITHPDGTTENVVLGVKQ